MKLIAFFLLLVGRTALCDFVVTFNFEELAVPDGKQLDGGRCDYYDMFGRECDMKLKLCIEDMKTSGADWNCRTGWKESNIIQADSNDVFFKQNTYYGDVPNPYRYLGQGTYQGVRMKVQIFDANFGNAPDAMIDQFQQVFVNPVGTNGQEYKIVHPRPNLQPFTLRFQYSAACEGSLPCAGTTTTTTPTPPPTTTVSCNLNSVQFDIMEITDASANMGSSNYAAVKSFLKSNFLPQFSIGTGSGQTEFSSGFYASSANAWLLFYMQTLAGVRQNIDRWTYVGGSQAVLDSGLNDENIVTSRNGYRTSAKHLCIIFGPGVNTGSNNSAVQFANMLRQKGIKVVAVALGSANLNLSLLNQIAGGSQNVIQLSSSSQLNSLALPFLNQQICSM